MFTPLNGHIEVLPIEHETFVSQPDTTHEEKGKVISVAAGIGGISVGDIVYFDSWLVAKYPDENKVMRWLVPFKAIRAKENNG